MTLLLILILEKLTKMWMALFIQLNKELKRNFNPKDTFIEKNNYIKKIFKKKNFLT